ncbi:MAG: ABC transporter ATP-binding protein [Pseudobdellovibrionaceae bacterium]
MKADKSSPRYLEKETRQSEAYSKEVFSTLNFAYNRYYRVLSLILVAGFAGRVLILANANVIGLWVDSLSKTECTRVGFLQCLGPDQYLLILGGLVSFGFVFTMIFRVGFSRVSAFAVSSLYDEVTVRTSRFPMSFFDRTPAGRIITRFSSDYGAVFRLFGGPLAEFIAIIFDLIAMTLLVTWASPYYLPFVVAIGALNYFVYRLNRETLRKERRELSASRSPSIAHFAETTQGAATIRAFSQESTFDSRFLKLNDYYLNQKLRTVKKLTFFSFQMNSLTAFLFLAIGLAAFYLVSQNLVSIGSVGVAFTFIMLSGTTIQMFFEWMAQFEEAMIGVERLDRYLRRDIESNGKLPASTVFKTMHAKYTNEIVSQAGPQNAKVVFDKVSFRYASDLPFVLKGLNFEIRAGERFGIVGRTGSGKSSLIQVLFNLYPIDQGKVTVDGHCPPEMDLNEYRKNISLITQEPVLFKGTLLENLTLDPSISKERILSILDKVGLRYLAEGPRGLQHQVEERGRNLSAGEKQLICMARCLLQDAPVVVMDEATSSVDPQSEEVLVKATEDFFSGRTQIIIAHRLSTLQNCDRILWLQKGEVKMIGKPSEVLPIFQKSRLEA